MSTDVNAQATETIYAVNSIGEDHEGWFPRGEVSLAGGASGSGKSTFMLPLLENIRQGNEIFSHTTTPGEYLIVMHDRSLAGFNRTARRLRLSPEVRQRVHRLTPEQQGKVASEVLDSILLNESEKNNATKAIQNVFIEGLDMWVPKGDITDFDEVCKLLDSLQRIAEKWQVAIIGSVGSPKQKAKDRYQLQRDSIIGSTAWGRKTETIIFFQLTDPEDPNSSRECHVLTRNGKAEKYELDFQHGRLVITDESVPELKRTPTEIYIEENIKMGEPVIWKKESGIPDTTFYRQRDKMLEDGLLFKQAGNFFRVKTFPGKVGMGTKK